MAIDTAGSALVRETRDTTAPAGKAAMVAAPWLVRVSDSIVDVEAAWRRLEANGIDGAGQSHDFVKCWIETFDIPASEQVFVVAMRGAKPLVVLGLHRRKRFGIVELTPFAGNHAGCDGPLIDRRAFGSMPADERAALWRDVLNQLSGDLVVLPCWLERDREIFALTGSAVAADTLYRTEFESWEACDAEQRNRSRRKHDKQQGTKLAAMGEVKFAELTTGDNAAAELDVMFADRAARFAEQGISDPFAAPEVRAFYRTLFETASTLRGVVQVLTLDGKVVATRYNLVSGTRMFCLISSMSMDPALSPGSPGKQILVHLMQRIFADGIHSFDMGAGYTDEKRHWCNVQEPLVSLFLPRTMKGRLLAALLGARSQLKAWIKRNAKLFSLLKDLRARIAGGKTASRPN